MVQLEVFARSAPLAGFFVAREHCVAQRDRNMAVTKAAALSNGFVGRWRQLASEFDHIKEPAPDQGADPGLYLCLGRPKAERENGIVGINNSLDALACQQPQHRSKRPALHRKPVEIEIVQKPSVELYPL